MQLSRIFSLFLSAIVVYSAPTRVEERATKCSPVGISAQSSAAVVAAFKSSGVVPTLIPSISPKVAVTVTYGSKQVNLGNKFKTTETLTAPSLSFSAEKNYDPSTTKYAVFVVDPDVPNPNGVAGLRVQYLHWAYHNAQPSCIKNQKITTDAIYQSFTPASTQQHRYTFLVYRQPAGYVANTVTLNARTPFDLQAYVTSKGLTLVGGNFFERLLRIHKPDELDGPALLEERDPCVYINPLAMKPMKLK